MCENKWHNKRSHIAQTRNLEYSVYIEITYR